MGLRDREPDQLLPHFQVLEFEPPPQRDTWRYASCGMSNPSEIGGIELHILSPCQSPEPVELLAAVAHFHRSTTRLGWGHTVNFGKPWIENSPCEHGLISLPYLDGPDLEELQLENRSLQFLWLLPITKEELAFKKASGLEALEARFEKEQINYLNPHRPSVC